MDANKEKECRHRPEWVVWGNYMCGKCGLIDKVQCLTCGNPKTYMSGVDRRFLCFKCFKRKVFLEKVMGGDY